MLTSYRLESGTLKGSVLAEGAPIPDDSLWLDLFDPTGPEREVLDALLGVELPTRADMEEIEVSSRLFTRDGATFMTALVLANSEGDQPVADVVTFVLARGKLVSIRYIDPQPFRTFSARCERGTVPVASAEGVLMGLLDVIIDRGADILEHIGADVEMLSRRIFNANAADKSSAKDFQAVLRLLGRTNDLTGKIRESLLTIARMLSFLTQAIDGATARDVRAHIDTLTRDVQSLQDHSNYLSGKLSYLLDATLGLINIDQNNIIKIMSVAAMVFLPPTLIASIEGMNFKFMPELSAPWGYPISIALMIVSAVVPYYWFKRRGWL